MAREATPVELYGQNNGGDKRRYTCTDTPAITKGTFLKFADPRTASASTGTGDTFAGIAAMEKEAADGSGAITAGQKVKTAAPGNYVMVCQEADISSYAVVVGVALETASDNETINVRVLI